MKNKHRLVLLATGILLFATSLLGVGLHKSITIMVDGQRYEVGTWALTVEQVLGSTGVALAPNDTVFPPLKARLEDGAEIIISRARAVHILADGMITTIYTADSIPAKWLAEGGILINNGDRLMANGSEIDPQTPSLVQGIQVQRQRKVLMLVDGLSRSIETTAATVGQALVEANLTLRQADQLNLATSTTLTQGLEVIITRAQPISIQLITDTFHTLSAADTVGAALSDAGFTLQDQDYSIPAENERLPDDRIVRIVRVKEEILVTQSPVPFQVEYRPDPELEIDNQTVIKGGVFGIEIQRMRVRYEDGIETSRLVEEKYLARPPENQVIGYGTKIVMRTAETPDGTITYWRAIDMLAVSYHPAETGSDITASGERLRKGIVAVDRRYIPFYTRLYIPGYGEAIAADTGGAVVGRIIDLGYPDDEYIPWYKRVTVYFLWPPPSNIVYIFP